MEGLERGAMEDLRCWTESFELFGLFELTLAAIRVYYTFVLYSNSDGFFLFYVAARLDDTQRAVREQASFDVLRNVA